MDLYVLEYTDLENTAQIRFRITTFKLACR